MSKPAYLPGAACLLALACSASHGAPMPYSNLIVFGDSLLDAGQYPDIDGPAGATKRFTNRVGPQYLNNNREIIGPVNSTLLGGKLGIDATNLLPSTSVFAPTLGQPDGNNWATGGNTTADILDSITGKSTVSLAGVPLRQRPGYLASSAFKADPKALYYLDGGANDFFNSLVTSQATAAAAAARLTDSVRALQQAGGRYLMVWLLPDLGLTPLNYGKPQQAALSQLVAAFNQALVSQLATVPAQIIPLNMPRLLSEIIANPASFGMITGAPLLTTCFSGSECTANPTYGLGGTSPDPSKLLFNDGVHPTNAGHQIIADYAYSLLAAPWELSLLPQMANATFNAQETALQTAWQSDAGAWQPVATWRAIVNSGGQRQDFDEQDSSAAADGHHYDLQVGGSYRLNDDWRAGLLAGAYRQSLKVGEADSRYKLDSYLGSAFMQFQHNSWWADGALTGGYLNYRDLQRTFALGINDRAEQGDTHGALWGLSSRFGYDLAAATSRWQLAPFISAAYSRVSVDGYAEQGERSTTLQIDSQHFTSKRLGAGLLGSVQVLPGTRVFAEVAHEHEFNADTQTLTMNQKSLPTLPYTLAGYRPAQQLNRLALGVNQQLTPQLALQAGYSLSKTDDLTQQGVNLGLSLSF
ncbi:outer membrane lipase/esterase [Pseudomonas sp. TE3786]